MDDTRFAAEMRQRREYAEAVLEKYLPAEEGLQKTVIRAMNYSVRSGGKRLRPVLMNETFRMTGGTAGTVEPFMAAIEMIHTYSLVHDDLPSLDNDEYRRGRKTTHAVFGEAMALLAGDGLQGLACETAASAFDTECSPRVARALQILFRGAGIYGMVGGQTADVENGGRSAGIETVEFIHRLKCGALIEAAMTVGAVLAGAPEDEVKVIGDAAADIGYAFQIRDDILDVTGSTEVLGKPVGSDEKNCKSTYVSLMGLEKAEEDVAVLTERAVGGLASLPHRSEFLEELARRLAYRDK